MKIQFWDELLKCILNYPILYLPHFHQKFVCEEIQNICKLLFVPEGSAEIVRIIECSHKELDVKYKNNNDNYVDYVNIIVSRLSRFIYDVKEKYDNQCFVCIIKNVDHNLINDARFVSLIHEFVEYYETRSKTKPYNCLTLVLCVPSCELPPSSISSITYVVNLKPPCEQDIRQELCRSEMKGYTSEIETEYVHALQGLQLFDVCQIIESTRNTYGKIIFSYSIKWAYAEKQELIRKTGVLEVVEPDVSLSDIGGLGNLKPDIESAARLYKNISVLRKASVPIPKGYLLLGMPGCGKSMIAKATATEFGCPLLKLDMGKLLGKYVGDSEHNLQIALDVVDSAHPCVLWIDEIEKAFAGTNNVSGEGDSVMMRLMGKFLTWMQERKTAVFIMATANDVLKPELMRKGRFDEVYFVDFPTEKEAEEIIGKTVEKYSNIGDGSVPFGLFTQEYIREIAKKMTESKVDDVHCLSGAEIKSLIDSTVAKKISELIKNANDKKAVDLNNLSISKDYLEEQLNTAKASAMINQKSPKNQKGTSVAKMSFIDKIYEFKEKYHFKPASI